MLITDMVDNESLRIFIASNGYGTVKGLRLRHSHHRKSQLLAYGVSVCLNILRLEAHQHSLRLCAQEKRAYQGLLKALYIHAQTLKGAVPYALYG